MNRFAKKILLLQLAALFLFSAGQIQHFLNRDRDALGLTRGAVLENAPPMLAFTTVALGGFRGLISNFLWIRANDLQQEDKFFEAAQLADWITKLEPTFTTVWVFQGWNMAYNISVKFKDFPDRWRWVNHGIELLRDDGLRYNPNSVLIYRELGWFFQHKMGANLDDANVYYKSQWAREMTPFFGESGTNFAALLQPENTNAVTLLNKFKIEAKFAKNVDEKFGPLDWRLPESHALYWASKGLDEAAKNPDKVSANDLITLRRVVYQSMRQSFAHGRIIFDPIGNRFSLAPNIHIIPKVNDAYMRMHTEETQPGMQDGILKAHRNFLRDAVYVLYENNRIADAQHWFNELGRQYPDKTIVDGDTNSFPRNLTLDQYAMACIQVDINETSQDAVTAAIQGILLRSYYELAIGDHDRYAGHVLLARKIYDNYQSKIAGYGKERIPLPSMDALNQTVLNQLLDVKDGLPYAARAVIRTQLRMPPEPPSTNAVENTPPPPPTK